MTSAHVVDPAVRGFLDALAANPSPPAAEQGVDAVRVGYEALSAMAGPRPEMDVVDSTFPGPAGPVAIRIYGVKGGCALRENLNAVSDRFSQCHLILLLGRCAAVTGRSAIPEVVSDPRSVIG